MREKGMPELLVRSMMMKLYVGERDTRTIG